VIPVSVATDTAEGSIRVRQGPEGIVVTPDGRRVYVLSPGSTLDSGAVAPIVTATNTAGRVITVPGAALGQMAIVP
jgi:DNA-binding beta-propeller fold protein YncE